MASTVLSLCVGRYLRHADLITLQLPRMTLTHMQHFAALVVITVINVHAHADTWVTHQIPVYNIML